MVEQGNDTKAVDLAAIRARRGRITYGEWKLDRDERDGTGLRFEVHAYEGGRITVLIGKGTPQGLRRDDALFVVNAPKDVDALLGLVEMQTRALLDAEEEIDRLRQTSRVSASVEVFDHIDLALTAAGLPDQLSRDMKRAELAGGG